MIIDDIVKQIPNSIASYYEFIYVVNKENNIFYNVQYNGFELMISKEYEYKEFLDRINIFTDLEIKELESDKEFKKVFKTKDNLEKLVMVDEIESYKIIYIIDITKKIAEDKKILLIADDSPIITKFFTKVFNDEYEILVAKDGNEAIDLINQYQDKPLIGAFLDLQMPNKNGYEVLEYFKENNLFSKIPVSIISGEDSADGIEKATTYEGVVDMLQKPFSAEAAKAIVNKTISFSPKNK